MGLLYLLSCFYHLAYLMIRPSSISSISFEHHGLRIGHSHENPEKVLGDKLA